jgi:hypothetical protein
MNEAYVNDRASRAIGGRFIGRKNRKERCKQFSEKRTSLYDIPKVAFPDAQCHRTQNHPVVQVREEKKIPD